MKSLITGALALALLASAAPAALAQDRPDRQNDDGGRGQGGGRGQDHQAPQAPPQPAAQPAAHPAAAPPAPGGQLQPGPRGYYRQDGGPRGEPNQGGYRGGDARGRGPNPGPANPGPANPAQGASPAYSQGQPSAVSPGQTQGQGRDYRNDGRYGGQHDAGRPSQGAPPPGMHDDRYRQDNRPGQDNRYRQDDNRRYDDGRRNDDGRRHDDRGRGDGRGYDGGRPGQDWQRDRPRYDRHDYPFRFDNHQRYRGFTYYQPRGFYVRHWGFGDIVPRSWWGPDYRLNDWWSYGLPIPPIGYEWVRVGDDALLVDIYSGRVVQVAYDIFY